MSEEAASKLERLLELNFTRLRHVNLETIVFNDQHKNLLEDSTVDTGIELSLQIRNDNKQQSTLVICRFNVELTVAVGTIATTVEVRFKSSELIDIEVMKAGLETFINEVAFPMAAPLLREVIYSMTDRAFPAGITLPLYERDGLDIPIPDLEKLDSDPITD